MEKEKKTSAKQPTTSERFIDQLYSLDVNFVDEHGKPMEVPDSGFLGLLTTGYKGTVMLRKARNQTHLYQKFTKGEKLPQRRPRPQAKEGEK
ncbi:MAG: hypothetical protein JW801_06920 [Bacteroidales bacterium]|nr:hypothetical protein [Bacteroidales bacterium]